MKFIMVPFIFRITLKALIAILFVVTLNFSNAQSEEYILSTFEFNPYIGKDLVNNGALTEIIAEAFIASGDTFDIALYPAQRAVHQVKHGGDVGIYPLYYNNALEKDFIFSSILCNI